MAAISPSKKSAPPAKPPKVLSGAKRLAMVSSSPDGKSEREAVQPKKKRALDFDQGVGEVDGEDATGNGYGNS
ncbi:unnamed protein product [Linum trigynum]|uniref:Uncharacterized protein n=1 Tax=Linum trigynum TaxID=586398 RepID=A0AAV2DF50_9ROSI